MGSTLLALFGPTATGKSAVAMRLAELLDGEIVNADALQVYRGLDIGTAKPSLADRDRVPHHLVDILDPSERFSAGRFARLARVAIAGVERRGCRPLVVGGSGLYLRALLTGLSPIPETPPELRAALARDLDEHGPEALHRRLAAVDPESAERLQPGDRQRIARALEVWTATGTALSKWQRRPPRADPPAAVKIGLTLPRALLYDRIAARVDDMLASGWVGEVEGLLAGGMTGKEPAFQAIGYAQIVAHLESRLSLAAARDEIVRATRNYAKRQLTWYRRESATIWISALKDEDDICREIVAALDRPAALVRDEQT